MKKTIDVGTIIMNTFIVLLCIFLVAVFFCYNRQEKAKAAEAAAVAEYNAAVAIDFESRLANSKSIVVSDRNSFHVYFWDLPEEAWVETGIVAGHKVVFVFTHGGDEGQTELGTAQETDSVLFDTLREDINRCHREGICVVLVSCYPGARHISSVSELFAEGEGPIYKKLSWDYESMTLSLDSFKDIP